MSTVDTFCLSLICAGAIITAAAFMVGLINDWRNSL